MRTRVLFTITAVAVSLVASLAAGAQAPATTTDPMAQGQDALKSGNLKDALAAFERAAANGGSFQAHLESGIVLDLLGRYDEARSHLEKAIAAAGTPDEKTRAHRTMAMAYGFVRNCDGAERHQGPLVEAALDTKKPEDAGGLANELARVCLESGNVDKAETWYRKGHEAGLAQPDLTPAAKDLWQFRWEHAQARIAARRGQRDAAVKHMAAAKAVLDKGTLDPNQAQFYPYLAGYVAFYGGDFKTAVTELAKANQNDPFILALLAQAHEKLGQEDQAKALYTKVLQSTAHNPTNAYARPLAQKKLGKV
jgi:tetratricopeptide (TPR) repeat protein